MEFMLNAIREGAGLQAVLLSRMSMIVGHVWLAANVLVVLIIHVTKGTSKSSIHE